MDTDEQKNAISIKIEIFYFNSKSYQAAHSIRKLNNL